MDGSGKTTYGYSALHTAVISRNLKVVQALTNRADSTGRNFLDSRDSMGFTPLHLAAMQGSRELLEMLLKAGCDVNSRTKEGMTSLHICSEGTGTEDILFTLATASCDVNARNKLGRTALHLAAKQGNTENLKKLLDIGCNKNVKDKLGFTAVGLAFKYNQKQSAEILLHYKPKRNRWSSQESCLDEGENHSVKHGDKKGKCLSETKNLRVFNASPLKLDKQDSLALMKRRYSVLKVCTAMILQLEGKVSKRNTISCFIHRCNVVLLSIKRDKLDGLSISRRATFLESFLERKLPTLLLGCSPPTSSSSGAELWLMTLDARLEHLCLCNFKRGVLKKPDSQTLGLDILWKLLAKLKSSLASSSILSSWSILPQRHTLSWTLVKSTLKRKDDIKTALADFMQILAKAFDKQTSQKIIDSDFGKTGEDKSITDSFIENNKLDIQTSNFVMTCKLEDCLCFLDHMIDLNVMPPSFVEDVLEFCFQNFHFLRFLSYRESLFSALLEKCLSRTDSWTADKIAKLFLRVSVVLWSDQRLLSKCADAVMMQGIAHCDCLSLGTCILVRMGLLKGECDTITQADLRGPLLALDHVFASEYFPRHLAAIFASFLSKSSPRLFGLDDLRLRALASAVAKEILPTSWQEAESDAGKSFKRICDIMSLEEEWEPLFECADVFLSCVVERLKCNMLRVCESVLKYLGLLKSESCIEVVRNLNCALKLLHHMAKQSYFPPESKTIFLSFLRKPHPSLKECYKEVEALLTTLQNTKAGL